MRLFSLKKNNKNDNQIGKDDWVYLTTAENEFEYNIIKGLLKENGIICVGKGRDLDLIDSGLLNIVLGPCIAVEIMVPKNLYDEADQLLNSHISDEEIEAQAVSEKEISEDD
jgi:hypothetical protein